MAGRQTVGIWLWTSPNPTFLLHGRSSRFFDWRVAERPWAGDKPSRYNPLSPPHPSGFRLSPE